MTAPPDTAGRPLPRAARHRSVLSVPTSAADKVAKALRSEADEVVLDLEDAVAVGEKERARDFLLEALADVPETAPVIAVRVNSPGSPWGTDDLQALAGVSTPSLSVVVPKATPEHLAIVDQVLEGETGPTITLQALIETAEGLARVRELASSSTRLSALVLGYADLATSLGRLGPAADDEALELWLPAQHALLVAAREAGLRAIDGPYLGVEVDGPFTAAVGRGALLGFDGKWVIHPRQIAFVNDAFTPSEEAVAHAREVLEVLNRSADQGAGAASLDGQMLDEAVAAAARLVLLRAGVYR